MAIHPNFCMLLGIGETPDSTIDWVKNRQDLDIYLATARKIQASFYFEDDHNQPLYLEDGSYSPTGLYWLHRNPGYLIPLRGINFALISMEENNRGLAGVDLKGCDFGYFNRSGSEWVSFSGACLQGAYFKEAFVQFLDMSKTDCRGVIFPFMCAGANFTEADLSHAIFPPKSSLRGACFKGANLSGTDISGALGLDITGAWINPKTRLSVPEFFESEKQLPAGWIDSDGQKNEFNSPTDFETFYFTHCAPAVTPQPPPRSELEIVRQTVGDQAQLLETLGAECAALRAENTTLRAAKNALAERVQELEGFISQLGAEPNPLRTRPRKPPVITDDIACPNAKPFVKSFLRQ